MKYNQLYAELKAAGCYVGRHGGEHDVWFSPKTGKKFSIPRHGSKAVSYTHLADRTAVHQYRQYKKLPILLTADFSQVGRNLHRLTII